MRVVVSDGWIAAAVPARRDRLVSSDRHVVPLLPSDTLSGLEMSAPKRALWSEESAPGALRLRRPEPAPRPPRHRRGSIPARAGHQQRCTGRNQIPFLGQHQDGGRPDDGKPLAPGFGPAAAIVQDHENLFASRLPEQSQGNRAAFTGVNAGIERLIAALSSRVGDAEPTSVQGLADGPDTGPCRASVGGAMDAAQGES